MNHDRRLTPARGDLAAAHLREAIAAPRYAEAQNCRISVPVAPLRPRPDPAAALDSELLFGEDFAVYDRADGWVWGQSALDGYVGYLPETAVTGAEGAPTHRVETHAATTYALPALKSPPTGTLPYAARLTVLEEKGGHARIGPDCWVPLPQVASIDATAPDWVAVAETLIGVPYIWGGRSSFGLDCSALIQLARQAAGHECPRDSDMQAAALGETLAPDAQLQRGDVIFWPGHVGVLLDGERLLHANAHHMAVRTEPLDGAIRRIAAAGDGEVTRRARLDAA